MEPYAQGAYGRIQFFLADLTLVLGSLLGATPYGSSGRHLPSFNQIDFAQQIKRDQFWLQPLRNRPTRQSRAWKNNNQICQPSKSARCPLSIHQKKPNYQRPIVQVLPRSVIQKPISENRQLDHYKTRNSIQATIHAISDSNRQSRDCQRNDESVQNSSEVPDKGLDSGTPKGRAHAPPNA
ncbi:hypothetical protein PCASD_14434 [Puccinia coronata f. sp. avenae]|uniref:Uncharacterized protein n=1 Tax=Puccinia coronata f. sp. avenae TaxID=200324 RepID=A0A2N5UDL1_9BASI|nr:hypothetical protein PCASD_14434 [Puccinia coronata f. sp. avenae]